MQDDHTLNVRQRRDAGWMMASGAAREFLTCWVLQAEQIVVLRDLTLARSRLPAEPKGDDRRRGQGDGQAPPARPALEAGRHPERLHCERECLDPGAHPRPGQVALSLGLLTAVVALTTAAGQIERGANRIYGVD
jgi:hypothetical protein